MPRAPRTTQAQRKVTEPEVDTSVIESQNEENPRPRRSPMDGGFRDRLTVRNKDPNFVYRWILDTDSSGARIHWMKDGGWDLAPNTTDVGQRDARNPNPGGDASIVRVPANKHGEYHYLMRIKNEWYDENQLAKAEEINRVDRQIHTRKEVDGVKLYDDPDNERSHRMDFNPEGS